jgi:hypothetical protein
LKRAAANDVYAVFEVLQEASADRGQASSASKADDLPSQRYRGSALRPRRHWVPDITISLLCPRRSRRVIGRAIIDDDDFFRQAERVCLSLRQHEAALLYVMIGHGRLADRHDSFPILRETE